MSDFDDSVSQRSESTDSDIIMSEPDEDGISDEFTNNDAENMCDEIESTASNASTEIMQLHELNMKEYYKQPITETVLEHSTMTKMTEDAAVEFFDFESSKAVASDASDKVMQLILDARKFMRHGKRTILTASDVKHAEKLHYAKTRITKMRMKEKYIPVENRNQINLNDFSSNSFYKVQTKSTIHAHWLAVNGVQPAIPQNPARVTKSEQEVQSIDPLQFMAQEMDETDYAEVNTVEEVELTHSVSLEKHFFYEKLLNACVGGNEQSRIAALESLQTHRALQFLLPQMCSYVTNGIRINVYNHNLSMLIYLMRMMGALVNNESINLAKYLDSILSSVLSCILCDELCPPEEYAKHWILRDFAAQVLSNICKRYNNILNNLQTRVTRVLAKTLSDNCPLTRLYGSIVAVCELGQHVIDVILVPFLKRIANRVEHPLLFENDNNPNKIAADHILKLVVDRCPIVLSREPSLLFELEEYKKKFGYFGRPLYTEVSKLKALEIFKK